MLRLVCVVLVCVLVAGVPQEKVQDKPAAPAAPASTEEKKPAEVLVGVKAEESVPKVADVPKAVEAEAPKAVEAEAPKAVEAEAPKQEQPKQEEPKQEQPKQEAPKTAEPTGASPPQDGSQADPPKALGDEVPMEDPDNAAASATVLSVLVSVALLRVL